MWRLLAESRLVTLTGVGGVGKTRLALEAAARAVPDFADGAFFADLAALTDPAFAAAHVARALDVHEYRDAPAADQLAARLLDADLLLVLDNCEHLLGAVAELAQRLLTGAPRLRILATSRRSLGVAGEVDYPVPPLAEADRLFLARAREARPSLREDSASAEAVARICSDLDGLPLAIELAAARANALSLEEIAARLGDRFRFLVSWRRLSPARHRTLRAAMDWSYDLLAPGEQSLLARLSVFAGGFTIASAAAVCLAGDEERTLELGERLIDASLILAVEADGEMRYRLLETVRRYAAERLEDVGETEALARAHRRFFLEVAEDIYARVQQSGELHPAWFDAEQDNLRAALETAGPADVDDELRLAGALWRFWWVSGQATEGRAHLARALERGVGVSPAVRARALQGSAGLAWSQGDYELARDLATEALAAARSAGATWEELAAHNVLGVTALHLREFALARHHLERSAALSEQVGNLHDLAAARMNLGLVALDSGDTEAAIQAFEELLATHRANEGVEGIGFAQLNLGTANYRLQRYENARSAFEEARGAFASIGFRSHVGHALQGLTAVEARAGSYSEAAGLLGRAAVVLADVGAAAEDFDPTLVADAEARARAALGDEAFAEAYAKGEQAQPR